VRFPAEGRKGCQTCGELKDQRSARSEHGPVPRKVESDCNRYRPSERPTEGHDRRPHCRSREDAPQQCGLRCSNGCPDDQPAQEQRLHGRVVTQEHLTEHFLRAIPPAVAGTQSADSGKRHRSTSHWAAPITAPARAPPIGMPRNAAAQAGQNHRPPRTGLATVLLRIMMLCLSGVSRTRRTRYERAIACAAGTASIGSSFWRRAQATVCRIASRSGVASSPNVAA
jgi:hypothetical protein